MHELAAATTPYLSSLSRIPQTPPGAAGARTLSACRASVWWPAGEIPEPNTGCYDRRVAERIRPDVPARIAEDRRANAERYFSESRGSVTERLEAFPRFVDRSTLGRFLVRYELVKLASPVHGSIVECGIYDGGGLFGFAHASALVEPLNHRRRVIGFDTFAGFPAVDARDTASGYEHAHVGAYHGAALQELELGVELFDDSRPLAEIPKIHFVAGDFLETGPTSSARIHT